MADPEGRVTLWGIEVFLAAADEGSISAAARRLGVSPSGVSQQLSGLEAALGTPLLDRSARPMRMTTAGTIFRRHAQVILNAATEAKAGRQTEAKAGRPPQAQAGRQAEAQVGQSIEAKAGEFSFDFIPPTSAL